MAASTFDNLFTFTRASVATITDIDGMLREVGADVPRLVEYDGAGGALGLLIEEQRTNLVTYSEQFDNAAWDKDEVSITADNAIAPNGMTTADLMQATATAVVKGVIGDEGIATIGQDYVLSIYGKEGSAPYLLVNPDATAFSGDGTFAGFDLSLGVVLEVGGSSLIRNTYIEKAANGFFRCSLVIEADTAGALMLRSNPYSVAGSLVSPSIGDNVHIWGAQVEEGSFPTSYIPTTGTQVTRAADDCSRATGTELNLSEFTIYCDYDRRSLEGNPGVFVMVGGTSGDALYLDVKNRDERVALGVAGSTVLLDRLASAVLGRSRFAISLTSTECIIGLNGVSYTFSNLTNAVPRGIDFLAIGRRREAVEDLLNGTILDFRIYPERKTDAELIALTGGT